MLLASFENFLNENAVLLIILFLSLILLIAFLIKKYLISKYEEPEVDQTQEEIVKQEMDRLLITEEYKPVPKKIKKKPRYESEEDSKIENANKSNLEE